MYPEIVNNSGEIATAVVLAAESAAGQQELVKYAVRWAEFPVRL